MLIKSGADANAASDVRFTLIFMHNRHYIDNVAEFCARFVQRKPPNPVFSPKLRPVG